VEVLKAENEEYYGHDQ